MRVPDIRVPAEGMQEPGLGGRGYRQLLIHIRRD